MSGFDTGFFIQPRLSGLTRVIGDLRQRGDAAQSEAVTGRPADLAQHLSGRVAEAVSLKGTLDRLAAHGETIALTEARTDATARSLSELRAIAVDLANDADTALASGLAAGRATVSASARDALGRAVAALNVSLGGRTLLAGDATDRAALTDPGTILAAGQALLAGAPSGALAHDALIVGFTDPAGVYQTTLYTGGTGTAPRAEIAPGEAVGLPLRADSPELRETLAHIVALAHAFDGSLPLDRTESEALAGRAISGLRRAADDLAEVGGRVGVVQERIAVVKARNTAEEAGLTIAFNDLTQGDPFAAAVRFNAVEGQIETLFATTARLSGVSLGAFLR